MRRLVSLILFAAACSRHGGATADAAAGTSGAAGTAGTGVAGAGGPEGGAAGAPAGPAKNYQLTGTWPALKATFATKKGTLAFTKIVVHEKWLASSCSIADYNKDGQPDVSSGRRWWEGPTFKTEHTFRGGHDELPLMISGSVSPINNDSIPDDTADYPWDLDGDGWTDIINIAPPDGVSKAAPAPQPAATATWYQNPGASGQPAPDGFWTSHVIHKEVQAEHHGLADVDGDGRPEIFGACRGCVQGQSKGYYQADWTDPAKPWTYHGVTVRYEFPYSGTGAIHGLGFGDVNGDGRPDFLEKHGIWLQQPQEAWSQSVCPGQSCGWIKVDFVGSVFAPTDTNETNAGSHIYAADFDGDGDADIFSVDWAHGYGMAWYEQQPGPTFVRHQIMGNTTASDLAKFGPVAFTEPHAVQVVDMDGDGIPDVVTGKQFLSMPFTEVPDPMGKPVMYVFKTVRQPSATGGPVTFEPHLVDDKVGIGTQIAVGHANTDGVLDLCVATKLGLAVYLGQ